VSTNWLIRLFTFVVIGQSDSGGAVMPWFM